MPRWQAQLFFSCSSLLCCLLSWYLPPQLHATATATSHGGRGQAASQPGQQGCRCACWPASCLQGLLATAAAPRGGHELPARLPAARAAVQPAATCRGRRAPASATRPTQYQRASKWMRRQSEWPGNGTVWLTRCTQTSTLGKGMPCPLLPLPPHS